MTDEEAKAVMDEIQRDQRNGEIKLRRLFVEHCDDLARYWADQPNLTPYERTSGVMFSLLASIDGTCPQVPGFDMISATNEEVGNVLIEEGTVITHDRNLHTEYTAVQKARMEAANHQIETTD